MPELPLPDSCIGCPLYTINEGRGFTSLEGYGESGLVVVAEAAGENEREDGLPLRPYAASGGLVQRALNELGINRQSTTLTNCIRCQPPGNELYGQPWTYTALDHCSRYLDGVMAQRRPTMILALGDTPYQQLSADHPGSLSEVRGFVLPSKYGIPLVVTWHPAFIVRGSWQLYGAFKRDLGFAYHCAANGVPVQLETDYVLHPSLADVRRFLDDVLAHPEWPIGYDVETAHMLGEKEPDDWKLKRLVQLQFSVRPGHAIVLPWDGGPYTELAKAVLATPNPKWGWNSARSDDIILQANGVHFNGERHDLMLAWAHLQPDFTAKGDDREGDEKGIPSKLMGLQSAASFYCPEVGPWKHLGSTNLQLYGAYDADYTGRCGRGIFANLDALGLTTGYREHKYELRFTLDEISAHGLPVDRERQSALRVYTLGELYRIQTDLHAQVPAEILGTHPAAGYRALHSKISLVDPTVDEGQWEKVALKAIIEQYDVDNPPLVCAAGKVGWLKQRWFETIEKVSTPTTAGALVEVTKTRTHRWCIERLYNPHASSPNTKAYIRYRGYRMPTHIVTGQDTTGKTELLKLAKETGDRVLQLTYDWRDLAKTGLDYTTGKWVPGEDGRVHGTFRTGTTASGQTTCTEPNCYSADTEILTDRGWVLFPALLDRDRVAQYDSETGQITLVLPDSKIVLKELNGSLCHITTQQKLDLLVTEDHRCPLRHRKTGKFRVFNGADYPTDWQQVQAGYYANEGVYYTEAQIALIAALQADGHVGAECNDITFAFSRQRKAERLRWALTACGIKFTETGKAARKPTHKDQRCFYISPSEVPVWWADKKFYGPWVLELGTETFNQLANEVFLWDGLSTRKNNYSSSDRVNSDWVQIMMVLTGRRAKIREYKDPKCPAMRTSYQVDISNRDCSLTTNRTLERVPYSGLVYCVTVPTGFIVVRRNDKVAISGNCQQFPEHSELAKRAKAAIRAEPGHIFVKVDMRGFHSRVIGWFAKDPLYYQLADEDVHSFITAHFLHLHDAPYLMEMDEDERRGALAAIKAEHTHTRNYKIKRAVHGRQFGMHLRKLYQLHGADFDPTPEQVIADVGEAKWYDWEVGRQLDEIHRRGWKEAKKLFGVFDSLFPHTFILYPEWVREQIYNVTPNRLVSPFGHHRFFWSWDMEQANAYLPSNCAHCEIQSALNRMRRSGDLRRFGCCNLTHDAGWFHPLVGLADECVATVQAEFEAPSTVLTNNPLGPFQCNSDAEVGYDMSKMVSYDKWVAKGRPGPDQWDEAFPAKEH